MSYAKQFADQQVVMSGVALRRLRTLQCIDEMPTEEERVRTLMLYFHLGRIEHWKAAPLMCGCYGMIAGVILAGLASKGAPSLGVVFGMLIGLVLGFVTSKLVYYDRRLRVVSEEMATMFRSDPDTWKSLDALKVFDPYAVGCAWKFLPHPAQ